MVAFELHPLARPFTNHRHCCLVHRAIRLDLGVYDLNASLGRCNVVKMRQIEDLSRRIGQDFHPQRILLFGSYAWGKPTADSDVDLLVILSFEGKPVDKSVEIRLKTRPAFPVDLLVRTPERVQERIELGDSFMKEIIENGKVLYEADHN